MRWWSSCWCILIIILVPHVGSNLCSECHASSCTSMHHFCIILASGHFLFCFKLPPMFFWCGNGTMDSCEYTNKMICSLVLHFSNIILKTNIGHKHLFLMFLPVQLCDFLPSPMEVAGHQEPNKFLIYDKGKFHSPALLHFQCLCYVSQRHMGLPLMRMLRLVLWYCKVVWWGKDWGMDSTEFF